MKILIKNATLISMSEKREKIENNMDIKIENNKISEIGLNLSDVGIDKIIDATGKVVMPGLINTHSHVPMSIFRETADGYGLQEWLTEKIWPMEDKLINEDIYYASKLSFIEMIETGCTTINDMYCMAEDIIKAALETGVRLQTTRSLMSINNKEERIKEFENLLNNYKDKYETITFNAGIHGLYTNDREYVQRGVKLASKYELPIHMHFCENSKELEDIFNIYGEKPIDALEKELKGKKILLAHCVKLDKTEIKRLQEIGNISIAHCPVSNLKLGCGIADITEMLKQGLNVSLGTDGQGSGCNLDMFETMKYAALLQKGKYEDAKLVTAYEVLKMATINGAKALGLEEKIGSIEEGKQADLIIIQLNNAVVNPINDLCSDIVYNVKGNNVDTTIINGNILMENKKIDIDKNYIYKKCKGIIKRIQ